MLSKLKELAKGCENELYKLYLDNSIKDNIKNYSIRYEVNYRAKRRLGECRYISDTFREINVSSWLLKDFSNKDIKNTIMHELLHCLKGCNNHGYLWQRYASIVNRELGYNISRLTNVRELCNNNGIDYDNLKISQNKYQITCKKCGSVYYKTRLNDYTKKCYLEHKCKHTICGGKDFKVVDLKNNIVICDN